MKSRDGAIITLPSFRQYVVEKGKDISICKMVVRGRTSALLKDLNWRKRKMFCGAVKNDYKLIESITNRSESGAGCTSRFILVRFVGYGA